MNPMSISGSSRIRRRLRGLAVLGVIVVVGLGWLLIGLREAHRQKQAVKAVRDHGGWVFYNCQYSPDGWLKSAGPFGPRWLQDLLGVDFLSEVNGVKFTEVEQLEGLGGFDLLGRPCPGVTDDTLVFLQELRSLQWLALHHTKISDAGLPYLQPLGNLERLWLNDTLVTDQGMADLAPLQKLKTLSLSGTRVGDAGLLQLRPLSHLERLRVDRTGCTLAGVLHLLMVLHHRSLASALEVAGYAKCDEVGDVISLDLSRARLTDSDLACLPELPKLQWLSLAGTPVTDAGMAHLAPLSGLELLHLDGTRVTDAGLPHLRSMSKLRTLHLTGAKTTKEGRKSLQQALPNLIRVQPR